MCGCHNRADLKSSGVQWLTNDEDNLVLVLDEKVPCFSDPQTVWSRSEELCLPAVDPPLEALGPQTRAADCALIQGASCHSIEINHSLCVYK